MGRIEDLIEKKNRIIKALIREKREVSSFVKRLKNELKNRGYLKKTTLPREKINVTVTGIDSAFTLVNYTTTNIFYCTTVSCTFPRNDPDRTYRLRGMVEQVDEVVDNFSRSVAAANELVLAREVLSKSDLVILDGSILFFLVGVKIGEDRTVKGTFPFSGKELEDVWDQAKSFLVNVPYYSPPFEAKVVFVPKSSSKKDLLHWIADLFPEHSWITGFSSDYLLADLLLETGEYVTNVTPERKDISAFYGMSRLDETWKNMLDYKCTYFKGATGRIYKFEHHLSFSPEEVMHCTLLFPIAPVFYAEKTAREVLKMIKKPISPVEEEIR